MKLRLLSNFDSLRLKRFFLLSEYVGLLYCDNNVCGQQDRFQSVFRIKIKISKFILGAVCLMFIARMKNGLLFHEVENSKQIY